MNSDEEIKVTEEIINVMTEEEKKERKRAYDREYSKRPEVKERKKKYFETYEKKKKLFK